MTLLIDDGTGAAWDVAVCAPGPLKVGPLCAVRERLAPFRLSCLAVKSPAVEHLISCGNLLFGPLDVSPDAPEPTAGAMAGWRLLEHLAHYYWALGHGNLPLTHLTIENLEAFLHPRQQAGLVLVLARAVRDGLRVVVTTSSLTVLYAVNNLVQAARLGERHVEGVPLPEVRLPVEKVAAYACARGIDPVDLVHQDTGFIAEATLGEVSAHLQDEMSLICRYLPS